MRKINFVKDVFPHLAAVVIFLVVTVFFFSPVFFDHKSIKQYDIDQGAGLAKDLTDYREATGEEGLWAASAFAGMPAYLVSVKASNGPVVILENIYTLFLPHPVSRIFAAFLSFYIMLLAFGVRPWLAIPGALAFGLSSYMIIGLSAGHNARISAVAFMPLVVAGIHLAFSNKRILGFGVAAAGLAFEMRSNHLQITYYLALIVLGYAIMQFVVAIREKQLAGFFKTSVVLIGAAVIGIGSFFFQIWSVTEYTPYSFRGASELQAKGAPVPKDGLEREYAFRYKYGLIEPITLLVPEFYGGSPTVDEKSSAYQALIQKAQQGQDKLANQLAGYARSYWGPGTGGAYYAGAIIVFLFVLGIILADKKYVWWLVPLSVLSLMLSVGDSLASFNYWMFDHFPMYNKFRSFSFGLAIILFCMPLLGFIGLEKLLQTGINKETKRKLLIAISLTGGICLLLALFASMGTYTRDGEEKLPAWFLEPLINDRIGLLRGDAFRSFVFIGLVFAVLYFDLQKRISQVGFLAFMIVIVLIDLISVDKRTFTKDNFQRRISAAAFLPTPADEAILQDKGTYRVIDLSADPLADARASYFHHSLGGYHGAKMHRYQDIYDSGVVRDLQRLSNDYRSRQFNPVNYTTLNMLNTKYLILGQEARDAVPNGAAFGNAWFVKNIETANTPTEELQKTVNGNPKQTAYIDASKFKATPLASFDSTATISLTEFKLPYLKYESQSLVPGVGVFSEIYYPKGWHATIDGKDAPILRADYVLRALEIPAGKHTIEFKFEPKPYFVGNKITLVSSLLVLLAVVGSIVWSLKKE